MATELAQTQTALSRLETAQARMEAEQTRLREQLNHKLDDILDKLAAVRADADNTRAHVLYGLQENLSLSQRITKLEDEMRRR
jgi:DNA-binding FrmR family transcriptional regulator